MSNTNRSHHQPWGNALRTPTQYKGATAHHFSWSYWDISSKESKAKNSLESLHRGFRSPYLTQILWIPFWTQLNKDRKSSLERGLLCEANREPHPGLGLKCVDIHQLERALVPGKNWNESQGKPQEHSDKARCWRLHAQKCRLEAKGDRFEPNLRIWLTSKSLIFWMPGQKHTW